MTLKSSLQMACRNLWNQKSYTILNLLGLSVGTTGTMLIFFFLHYHLSVDRYHKDFDRIVRISTDLHLKDGSIQYNPAAPPPLAKVLRTQYTQVDQAAFLLGMRDINVGVKSSIGNTNTHFLEHEGVAFVEPEWLEVLTYHWLEGDPNTALRHPYQAVLTESWAKRYFGSAQAIGQLLQLDNKTTVTVTGVVADTPGPTDTPAGLFISLSTAFQLGVDSSLVSNWEVLNNANRVYARLKSINSLASLQDAMPSLSKQHYSSSSTVYQFIVQPLKELHSDVIRDPVHAIHPYLLWAFGGLGLLLILAACINFINLATVQIISRSKAVGIRKTLGSSNRQLVRQFLLETTLVCVFSIATALIALYFSLPILNRWLDMKLLFQVNSYTIIFILFILITKILITSIYPSFLLSNISPLVAMRYKMVMPLKGVPTRKILVVIQFIICQGLLFSLIVVTSQIKFVQQTNLGFNKDNILLINLPYDKKTKHDIFKNKLLSYHSISAVSLSTLPPSSLLMYGGSFKFDGKPDWEKYFVEERMADADYVRVYNLQLLAGRDIVLSDTIREYLVNETLMHMLGFQAPDQIIGRRFQHYLSSSPLPIVGVIKDFHLHSFKDKIGPCVITSWAPWYRQANVRLDTDNMIQTIQTIQAVWQEVFPNDAFEYQFFDEQIARLYQIELLAGKLLNMFVFLSIFICGLSLFGLISHTIGQRSKEIGVRKVLGASVIDILALLIKDIIRLVLIALIIVSPVMWWFMSEWLSDFVYHIHIRWWMFGLTGLFASFVSLISVSVQTIKAALQNPVKSLKTG